VKRAALLALLALTSLAPAASAAGLRRARAHLLNGRARQAVADYGRVRLTRSPETAAEYAQALAAAGFKDLALGHLDQALVLQENNPAASGAVNFHAARVFERLGQADVAAELDAQAVRPAWHAAGTGAPATPAPAARTDLRDDLLIANGLLLQRRYFTAVDRFQRLAADHPAEPRVFAGYAVALEKVGAFRKAARAVARAVELEGPGMSASRRETYEAHRRELESRPQTPPAPLPVARRANRTLKGRYLAFLGGNLHRTPQSTVANLNGRLGKFFTNRLDASLTAGYTGGNLPKDYRGASVGLAGRYHQPLPVPAPLNATLGSRVEYRPRPSRKTSVVVSPGLSWVREAGSFDLFYEYGVSGPLKETGTVSFGYTVYFGRKR
jgi:hypothetical protein